MKNRKRNKRNSGFTMVEMLVTVAILIILLSVSAVAVIQYMDRLKIAELDNAAREIYMAAENRAVLLSGAQRLSDLVSKDEDGNPDDDRHLMSLGSPHKSPSSEDLYYVYVSKDSRNSNIDDLLSDSNFDRTLLDNGDFYIVYDLNSGSVTDVFYAENKNYTDPLKALVEKNGGFATFYSHWAAPRDTRLGLKNDSSNENRTLVGWYNGEAAQSEALGTDTVERPYIDVTIINEEELTVRVTVKWDDSINDAVRKAIGGTDGKLTVELEGTSLIRSGGRFEEPQPLESGKFIYRCTWVLDSLEQDDDDNYLYQFKGLGVSSVVLGENFTVTATITSDSGGFITATDSAEDNSLFWKNDGGTASIRYLRHLQNLHTDHSGVNKNNTSVTSAVQIADIDGKGENENEEKEGYKFIPIINTSLTSYDGKNSSGVAYTIDDLYVNRTDSAYGKGLFGQFGYDGVTASDYTIKNVTITGSNIIGYDTMVEDKMVGGSDVGGIVGVNYGTVISSSFDGKVTGVTQVGGIAGDNYGIVGTTKKSGAIQEGSPLTACVVTGSVKGSSNKVGCLVGRNAGGVVDGGKVETNNVEVTGASYVGGFVGAMNGYGTVQNCVRTSTIIVNTTASGQENIGGIIGYAHTGTIKKCENRAKLEVANASSVGGIAGMITVGNGKKVDGSVGDSYMTMVDCDNKSEAYIKGAANVGGIVGQITPGDGSAVEPEVTVSSCNNAADVIGSGQYVGGIVGEIKDGGYAKQATITLDNCNNGGDTANEKSVTGTGGYVGGLVGRIECAATKNNTVMVLDSLNYATVNSSESYVGGLVGYNGGRLGTSNGTDSKPCTNYGDVVGDRSNSEYVGGVAGYSVGTVDGTQTIIEAISVTGCDFVGGFVGLSTGTVQNCTRPGGDTITVNVPESGSTAGGIVGQSGKEGDRDNDKAIIIKCINEADITYATCNNVGGIVGVNYGLVGTTDKDTAGTASTVCYNTGNVTGKDNVGGLVGKNIGGTVDGCNSEANEGTISGRDQVGGFVGYMEGGTVRNCYRFKSEETNTEVDGNSNVGGIVGQVKGGSIENCINEGPVKADAENSYLGGIVGDLTGDVVECRNTMLIGVDFSGKNYLGGIAGYVRSGSTVNKCYNGNSTLADNAAVAGTTFGKIIGSNYVGGITGYIESATISNSYNKANVEAENYVGGLVGASSGGTIQNNYNNGKVSGTDYVGGLLGLSTGTKETIINTNYVDGSSAAPTDNNGNPLSEVYQELVTATGSHYGTVVGSCKVTLVGMRKDDDLLPELKKGRIAGQDTGEVTGAEKVDGTSNNYYYTGTAAPFTVTANHTDTKVQIAGVELTRTFYRNNTGGAASGSGARLPSTLFNNNAVQSMNKNGGTDLWAWTGSNTDGRPVLLSIGEGEYVTWNDTGKPVVSVMNSSQTEYTVTATLADWVPTGGEWDLPADTDKDKIFTKWELSSVNGQECTFTVTVDTGKDTKSGLPMNYNAILEYTFAGEKYYGVITVNYDNFAGLAFYGGGTAGTVDPANLYYGDLGSGQGKLHVYFRRLNKLGGNPYSDYVNWGENDTPTFEITSFKIDGTEYISTSLKVQKATGTTNNPYVIIPVPAGFTLNAGETARMEVGYTVTYDTRNTIFTMEKTETITLHGGSYTASTAANGLPVADLADLLDPDPMETEPKDPVDPDPVETEERPEDRDPEPAETAALPPKSKETDVTDEDQPDPDPDTGPAPDPEPEADTEADPEPEAYPDPDTGPDPEPAPEPEPEPFPSAEGSAES